MLGLLRLCVLIFIQNTLVQCIIPGTLNVQKLDQKLIQRKRQDTLAMCKIFTAERERERGIHLVKAQLKALTPKQHTKRNRRLKRAVVPESMDGNPGLDFEDVKRVESIVDKFYDDVNDKGNKVTYRKKDVASMTSKMPPVKLTENLTDPVLSKASRRFQFRPSVLLGPLTGSPDGVGRPPVVDNYIPWPKVWSHGIIPYFIDPKTYDSQLIDQIRIAFDYFEKVTCIRLQKIREKPRDKDSMEDVEWVYITNPSGIKQCVHSNEKKINKGVQMVVLGYECLSIGEIVHEIMHVLGFSHEHTRPDRDKYITVMWDNIKPGYKKYFELRKTDILMSLDLPYDHASVLHYPARAFSRNGQLTLVAEQDIKLGQRESLSETDVAKVSMIYGPECTNRNKQYLLTTCPSVVKSTQQPEVKVSQQDIEDYFKDRLWAFGIVNYKLRDLVEFSADEIENIKAVITHIEQETCIEFRDLTEGANQSNEEGDHNFDKDSSNTTKKNQDTTSNPVDDDDDDDDETTADPIRPTSTFNEEEDVRLSQPSAILPNNPDEARKLKLKNDEETSGNDIKEENGSEVIQLENTVPPQKKVVRLNLPLRPDNTQENLIDSAEARNTKTRGKREAFPKPPSPHRRHANSILVLTRSSRPGCPCPKSGKSNGNQVLEINTDCFNSVNDLLHLFVHVLGLDHQHNMHDRDNFLHIFWGNMTEEVKQEFETKLPPAASVGFPYDYLSVMHYPWLEIKNGNINLMYPIWNDGWAMGHWQGLSSIDVQKLNLLYFDQCMERKKHVN